MILLPAIDMIHHQPVRLHQGDYEQKEVVGESILSLAHLFAQQGAPFLHLVDLDGAKAGKRIHQDIVEQIAAEVSIPVEIGGGIRTMADIDDYLAHGVARVILGTQAIENEDLLKAAVARYGNQVAVGLDCRNGFVATRGWLDNSEIDYLDFAKHLEQLKVSTIIFTDIAKDGTLDGPNLAMLAALRRHVAMDIIASGGVKTLDDIRALKALGIQGAIIGKAIYAKTLDLKAALAIAD